MKRRHGHQRVRHAHGIDALTLDARAPLYGRRTGQLRLAPLPFDAVRQFVPGYAFDDALRTAAVFGGIPHYLRLLDSSRSLTANIRDAVLGTGAPLRDEIEFLLRQELVETRIYFGILAAIAAGKEKLGEIINATHLPPGNVSKYLAVLQSLGLVARDVWSSRPVGVNVLDELRAKVERSGLAANARDVTFALFSRSGFTAALLTSSRARKDLVLVERLTPKSLRE